MISPQQKAQLRWHCRRGMLELDLILEKFLTNYLDEMTEQEFLLFELFLSHPDPDIYAWLMGYETPFEQASIDVVTLILSHTQTL